MGIWGDGGGGGGGGGGADVQRHVTAVRNKLIFRRIATALRVRSQVEAVLTRPVHEKPSAEIQKGYKHV